jgi:CAAX protease family protein
MTGGADRWPPWFGPLALLLGFIGGNLVAAIVVAGVPGGVSNGTASPAAVDIGTVILDLAFVGSAVLLARRVGRTRPRDFGLAGSPLVRTIAVLAAAVLAFIVVTAAWFAAVNSSGQEHELVKDVGGYGGTLNVVIACAVTCVVAPICEELLFRGFVYRSLRNWHGVWPAAIATGLLFGAVHGLSAPAVDLLPLAFLGVVLCLVYQATGSLYPCIAMHVLNNAIAFGSDEHWNWRTVELTVAALAAVALVLACVRLASARWTPAPD